MVDLSRVGEMSLRRAASVVLAELEAGGKDE